jgi:hypothetical protein
MIKRSAGARRQAFAAFVLWLDCVTCLAPEYFNKSLCRATSPAVLSSEIVLGKRTLERRNSSTICNVSDSSSLVLLSELMTKVQN